MRLKLYFARVKRGRRVMTIAFDVDRWHVVPRLVRPLLVHKLDTELKIPSYGLFDVQLGVMTVNEVYAEVSEAYRVWLSENIRVASRQALARLFLPVGRVETRVDPELPLKLSVKTHIERELGGPVDLLEDEGYAELNAEVSSKGDFKVVSVRGRALIGYSVLFKRFPELSPTM